MTSDGNLKEIIRLMRAELHNDPGVDRFGYVNDEEIKRHAARLDDTNLCDRIETADGFIDEHGIDSCVGALAADYRVALEALTAARRERDEARADRDRVIGRGYGDDAYILVLEERIAKLETTQKLANAIVANNATTAELIRERDEALANLKDAEEACLEAQNERDALQAKLDHYEPPLMPEKFS